MFIDLGSEEPNISDDEIGETTGNLFSTNNLLSVQDSDGENVEFIISSGESSDEETSQRKLTQHRISTCVNVFSANGYPNGIIDKLDKDYRLGTLYESETDSAKIKSDTDPEFNSKNTSLAESPPINARIRKYSSAKHPGVIPHDTTKRKRLPSCHCKEFLKNTKRRFFVILLAYIGFLCVGAVIFMLIEKPGVEQSGLSNMDIIDTLYDCHCLSCKLNYVY